MCRNTSFGHYFRCKESVDNNPQFHEIEFIYEISKNLGYERYFVDKAHYKARLAHYKARNKEKVNEKTLVLPPNVKRKY